MVLRAAPTRVGPQGQVLGGSSACVLAYVFVRDDDPARRAETGRRLAALPGVEDVAKVTGEHTFLVKLRTADTESLARSPELDFGAIETIATTLTVLALDTVPTAAGWGRGSSEVP